MDDRLTHEGSHTRDVCQELCGNNVGDVEEPQQSATPLCAADVALNAALVRWFRAVPLGNFPSCLGMAFSSHGDVALAPEVISASRLFDLRDAERDVMAPRAGFEPAT